MVPQNTSIWCNATMLKTHAKALSVYEQMVCEITKIKLACHVAAGFKSLHKKLRINKL